LKKGSSILPIKEAIILAGGLGTRLRSEVPDLPKCMAPVAGKPFISYVIDYFQQQGIERFIFSLGYLSEIIIQFLEKEYPSLDKVYSIEKEPLGTGGAIKLACKKATTDDLLILNGDTIFKIDLLKLTELHRKTSAFATLCLRPMVDFDRYGVVETDEKGLVKSFKEKKHYQKGNINGGVYALDVLNFMKKPFPEKFSFEKDFLEEEFKQGDLYGLIQNGYFIDIGIPEDYSRAQTELKNQ